MMRMQQDSHGFLVLLLLVSIAGIALSGPSTPRRSRVRRQNMKVRINATGDTIVMKFLRPNADTKLEGYILGYGSSMFSKQFIPLPENGEPYETEFDAEPKYLIAVQPIPTNDVKKHCTGKVELQKPLHLVIGSVTPTSVLLSWGTLLKTPHEGNIMNDCVEDGHYTVRYRERSRKWNYQTCPTSDTVIDNLKPNTVYEFGVQPNAKDVTGMWSKPVIHNISSGGLEKKAIRKIFKRPLNPVKPIASGPRSFPFAPRHAPTTSTTTTTRQESLSTPGPTRPTVTKRPIGGGDLSRSVLPPFLEIPLGSKVHPTLHITPSVASVPVSQTNLDKHGVYPQHRPQPKPKPTPQYITQTKPTSKLIPHTQPQPKPTSKRIPQTKPKPKPTSKLIPKTNSKPKPTSKLIDQTDSNPKPTSKLIPHTQPQPHPTSKLIPQTQPQPQPTSKLIHQAQPQPTSKLIPQTQPQPQPTSKPTSQIKHQPQRTSELIPQTQPQPTSQTVTQTQPEPQTTSSQTRTYSEPTKVTPRHTVPTAPSPAEEGKPLPRPALATKRAGSYNLGTGIHRPSKAEVPRSPISSSIPAGARNNTLSRTRIHPHSTGGGVRTGSSSKTLTSSRSSSTPGADGVHHRPIALPKPVVWSKENPVLQPPIPVNKRPNLVGKPTDHDKPMDLKQGDKESILKPFPLVTAKPKQERRQPTTTSAPAVNSSHFDIYENSSIFRPLPASDLDIMGKKRFVAPHVIYKTDKKPDEPCSITSSLSFFPEEEGSDQNVTTPPRIPPSNLTVVTVEGCPSFVILDWQKSDNETREYEVVSTAKGPNGQEVSILTTNQTHTAVENLKPESNYEFTVTPKNELGTGPSSDPVTFSTESADPRVSEYVAGKDAIWTQFPFKSDGYSECNGKQYVKRTWYRKFVGIQLCNSLRYKLYLSDSLNGKFYNIGDQTGHGEDHCQFVDSFLDGRTGTQMFADQLPSRLGFYRALRQEPVHFGDIGGKSHVTYVGWYECGTPIPGKW
ncbi:target of Nesh-SH3 [Limanda limanda]|uniref:target of Nesh-SH3 n=1 Tax=Limanda limanda TaxID=27771 RepID=UPI0029C63ED5|nr:target of Nesh-SH3 [Limanda limanda]